MTNHPPAPMTTCNVEGCDRPVLATKLCGRHYQRLRLHGNPLAGGPLRDGSPRFCSVKECNRPHSTHGWCNAHYQRIYRNGDPIANVPIRPPPRTPIANRFWRNVNQSDEQNGCWPWTASHDQDGYGITWDTDKQRLVRAHRAAWELANSPVPAGLGVLHRCDRPECCRPSHLFLGTHQDNMDDMVRKGRSHKGRLKTRLSQLFAL